MKTALIFLAIVAATTCSKKANKGHVSGNHRREGGFVDNYYDDEQQNPQLYEKRVVDSGPNKEYVSGNYLYANERKQHVNKRKEHANKRKQRPADGFVENYYDDQVANPGLYEKPVEDNDPKRKFVSGNYLFGRGK